MAHSNEFGVDCASCRAECEACGSLCNSCVTHASSHDDGSRPHQLDLPLEADVGYIEAKSWRLAQDFVLHISVPSTFDGRDVSDELANMDGIEAAAIAVRTAEILAEKYDHVPDAAKTFSAFLRRVSAEYE